jgi:vacuolar-type H+-ATPase subunit F/Vma7
MRMVAIGDRSFTALWRLVGVEALEANSDDGVRRILEKIFRSGEYSALILPERFLDRVNEVRSELHAEEQIEPVVIFVPEPGLGRRAEDLRRRISLAMGVEVHV